MAIQKGKKGKGNAMREAVNQSDADADIVVFIEGDGPVTDMRSLILPLLEDKADMVVGTRARVERWKGSIMPFNAIGIRIFNRAIFFALKSPVID